MTTKLPVSKIRTDGGTQPRSFINPSVVDDYAEEMKVGAEFEAAVVLYDGTDYWLADGFHRHSATRKAGLSQMNCDVRQGTRRDAILFSVGANARHGFRRSNADKNHAVKTLLQDEEWGQWSDREIARRCAVEHHVVASLRASLGNSPSGATRTYTAKSGKKSRMKTGKIGKDKKESVKRAERDLSEGRVRSHEEIARLVENNDTEGLRRADNETELQAAEELVRFIIDYQDEVLAKCAKAEYWLSRALEMKWEA